MSYSKQDTGPLLVDPYNDFLSEDGRLTGLAMPVADRLGRQANPLAVVAAPRQADIRVFYAPHHRTRPDDFQGRLHPTPYQSGSVRGQVFAVGSWGGETLHAAREINGPAFAHAVVTTAELLGALV